MAGYYNNLWSDPCFQQYDDQLNQGINDYQLTLNAHYRTNMNQAMPLSTGRQPDTYGPLRGRRVTQESFLQGRGQALSDCPDCGVRWLPETLFPQNSGVQSQCQRTDIQPLYTKVPKSCNGLQETDITQYSFMPGAWQRGYTGYNAVVDTNLQSRQAPQPMGVQNGGESYGGRQNYGTFGSGRPFSKYS